MRLKRLELLGFKSFADRTVMDFGEHRLTGIVGPNGCGKSNVVDAVRWVLGETRPTSMRGSGMTDVIFKGSSSRPGMSMTEVTMVLDNSSQLVEERGAEVAITRRLFKSGEGEYLIDGEKVRLKDVRDMLFDTGLGSRGYSVLEQGKIDAVLSANPQDRRSIFEEAAGISRYRQRRHEADLRLKRVEQDVKRLDDVLRELRTRARSLKIQAGKAERWIAVRDEYVSERRRFFQHRYVGLSAELAALAPEIERLEAELEELRGVRASCEAELAVQEEERTATAQAIEGVTAEVTAVAGELRALEERRKQLEMRVASWRQSATEEADRARSLQEALEERRAELVEMREDEGKLDRELAEAQETAGGLAGRARELEKRYRTVRQSAQDQNEAVLERLHERTAAQNALRHLEGAREPAQARLERVKGRLEELDTILAGAREETAAAEASAAAAGQEYDEAESAHEGRRTELEQMDLGLTALRKTRGEREVERAAMGARIETLMDREAELASLSDGTRAVLEAIERGEGPCSSDDLRGILADHVGVDVRLARALDAALGERAQCLVARDSHVALSILGWLDREEIGQVQVVVPRGIGAPDCPSPGDYALFARFGNAVEGRLCELVECEADMRPLVRALLCDVVVVSDLDVALDLVGREPGWRFVTPRGELVDAAGVVGGHREVSQGAVGRRSTAAELGDRVEVLEREISTLDEELEGLGARRSQTASELERAAEVLDRARSLQSERERELSTVRARLSDQEAAREEYGGEHRRAGEEIERVETELVAASAALTAAEAAFTEANGRLEEVEVERRTLEERREELGREAGRAELEATKLSGELSALRRRISDSERRDREDEAEVTRAEGRSRNFTENAEQGKSEGVGIDSEAERLEGVRGEADARLETLRAKERESAERRREVREQAEKAQRALDTAGERLSDEKLERQRRELAREELTTRAREELDLEPSELVSGFEPEPELEAAEAMAELERRVSELKGQMDKIGPVNTEAVHELEEVQTRLDFLEEQAGDLADSRKNLEETINKIDGESRRLFVEAFDEVRVNFQRIFRQLFGGGRADIRLEDGEDVLSAGIEIVARPPGREMLPIALLSGGQRTMTALALLFAVFEARPSPFCVLDEVDAALDDANIDRFLGMLETFLESTQFVIVTHNKGSMAACEALYGVTMQVKGVSRYVAVTLEEAEGFAPKRTAAEAPAAGQELDPQSGEPIKELIPGGVPTAEETPADMGAS